MVQAFEGNKAVTATMLPTIEAFKAAHRVSDVTIIADAGMLSAGNQAAIEAAELTYVLGAKIPQVPYGSTSGAKPMMDKIFRTVTCKPSPGWPTRRRRPQASATARSSTSAAPTARRTLRGIDERIGKAEQAVAGKALAGRSPHETGPKEPKVS